MSVEDNHLLMHDTESPDDEFTIELESDPLQSTLLAKRSLVKKILSQKPLNRGVVKSILIKAWENHGEFQITDMGKNMFLFSFGATHEVLEIIKKGPWYIMGHLLSLQFWVPDVTLYEEGHNTDSGGAANPMPHNPCNPNLDHGEPIIPNPAGTSTIPTQHCQNSQQKEMVEVMADKDMQKEPNVRKEQPQQEDAAGTEKMKKIIMTLQPPPKETIHREEESQLIVGWNQALTLKRNRDAFTPTDGGTWSNDQ
ncbi:hypothetical protein SESBI_20959 [Sesbania bispinosa]|nr:hypothetical protein SESBI_20959 [Sesbania bispinosa]